MHKYYMGGVVDGETTMTTDPDYCNIIVIQSNVVTENFLLIGEMSDDFSKQVEEMFLDKCAAHISNWDEYTSEDIAEVLDQGFERTLTGTICINWPERENTTK